jgi:hypothetical protein
VVVDEDARVSVNVTPTRVASSQVIATGTVLISGKVVALVEFNDETLIVPKSATPPPLGKRVYRRKAEFYPPL